MGIFGFTYNSIRVFSETNETNFSYSSKVVATMEELDKIVERGEVNLDVLVDSVALIYDVNKANDFEYNKVFIERFNVLTKSALINSPGANGIWFQISTEVPNYTRLYNWHLRKGKRIIDLKKWYDKNGVSDRPLTPEEDPYYFGAVKAKKTIWSDVYRDPDTHVAMITVARPIYRKSHLIGVMGVDFSLADLVLAMQNMHRAFPSAEILLLDLKSNVILTEPVINWSKPALKHFNQIFSSAVNKNENIVDLVDKGVKKTAVIMPISNEYHVVIMFLNSEIYKGYEQLLGSALFVFLILILLITRIVLYSKMVKKMNILLADESKKLRDIFNAFPSPIVMKNLQGEYVDCNAKFMEVMDLTYDKIIGKKNSQLFHSDLVKDFDKHEEEAKKSGRLVNYEMSYPKPGSSSLVHLQHTVVPLYNSNHEMIGLLIIAVDVSRVKEEEVYWKKAKDAAERATAMKSSFLANMSHEIRTPLNGILGFIQLLQDTNTTEEQAEFIKDAQKSSEILLNVINDILDFSKIEANKLQIDNISFNVRSVIEDITIISTAAANAKGIEVSSLICSDVPHRVFGDPGRIKQVVNNLVNNAIKFTSKGEIVIVVKQEHFGPENCIITFEVKDTGIGIEEDKLHLIFEEFAQADPSMTRKYGGTGLGLAISQRLVKLMKGTVNVESEVGKGSVFSFSLPFKLDIEAIQTENNNLQSISGKKILLVNSNPTDNKVLSYYLGESNCIVYQAETAQEAFDIIKSQDYNISVIIVDSAIQKNEGGTEFSAAMRSHVKTQNIHLILCTSFANRGDSIQAREKGFSGFLTKPIKKSDLIQTIAMVINNEGESLKSPLVTKHVVKEFNFDAKLKLLVVEDSEINKKLICKILANNKINCDVASNGQEALSALARKSYDLILMDCQMPVMDGYEATKRIREMEAGKTHTPIVALTANALVKDDVKCYEAGMDDYLSKPVKVDALLEVITKHVKKTEQAVLENKEEIN